MFSLIWQVETVSDYDEYCHYVAGLVGLGLSKLFHNAGLEDLASDDLSNSMGLFLQVLFPFGWDMELHTSVFRYIKLRYDVT